jgi:hypothetical protein
MARKTTPTKTNAAAWNAWRAFWLARDARNDDGMRAALAAYENCSARVNGHGADVLREALNES